jgi:hypothetical protein
MVQDPDPNNFDIFSDNILLNKNSHRSYMTHVGLEMAVFLTRVK